MTTPRERERAETRASWDNCVDRLVGPAVGPGGSTERKDNALHLAAAALRFAGQGELAAKAEALAG